MWVEVEVVVEVEMAVGGAKVSGSCGGVQDQDSSIAMPMSMPSVRVRVDSKQKRVFNIELESHECRPSNFHLDPCAVPGP